MRPDSVKRLAAVTIVAILTSGCDEVPPKEGISESDVVRLLGAPVYVITDRSVMDFYLPFRNACARDAVKVLYYERWLREDLTVAIDHRGRVRCTSQAHYMTHD